MAHIQQFKIRRLPGLHRLLRMYHRLSRRDYRFRSDGQRTPRPFQGYGSLLQSPCGRHRVLPVYILNKIFIANKIEPDYVAGSINKSCRQRRGSMTIAAHVIYK